MRLSLLLALSVVALSFAPTADAWPPVCIEKGAQTGIVNVGVMVTCGVDAWVESCVPGRGCTRHHLLS